MKLLNGKGIFILNIVYLILAFLQTIIAARILDISLYGQIIIASSSLAFIQSLIGLRTNELVLRYYDAKLDNKYIVLKKILIIDVKITSIILLFCYVFSLTLIDITQIDKYTFQILLLTLPVLIGSNVLESLLVCENKIYLVSKIKVCHQLLAIVFCSLGAYYFSANGYIIGLIVSSALRNLILYLITYKDYLKQILGLKVGDYPLEGFVQFSVSSYLSGTFKSGVGNLDIIILSYFVNSDRIAVYKVAKNLSAIPNGFMGSLWNAAQNKILIYSKNNEIKKLNTLTNYYTKIFVIFGFIVFPCMLLFADPIITYVYGDVYNGAYVIFIILMIGNYIAYSAAPFGKVFYIAQNKMKKMMYLNAFSFFFILILGVLFGKDVNSMAFVVAISIASISLYTKFEILMKNENYKCS